MPTENTQYGLKNKLKATSLEKVEQNLLKLELQHPSNKKVFLHILVLSEDIVRFHYSFDSVFNLEINPHIEFENFHYKDSDYINSIGALDFETKNLKIKIDNHPLAIKIYDSNDNLISADEPGIGFYSKALDTENSHELRCYKQYSDLENPPFIYGLGDKTGSINRWGRRFRNAPLDALGYDSSNSDPLYKDIPFFIHLCHCEERSDAAIQSYAHGIFFDNFYPKFFDFGRERKPSPYYYFGAENGELNYYFINGPEIKNIVSRYLNLTGKPEPVPSFSFGYLASGMSYTENYDRHCERSEAIQQTAGDKLLETFKKFKDKNIPSTAFHLSSGYIQDDSGQRQQFIWNNEKFPDPKTFSDSAKELGVELCANVKPVLLCSHPWYQEADQKGLFIKKSSLRGATATKQSQESETLIVDYWGGAGSYMDFRKPEAQKWWKEKLRENILANGIRGIWNDNNEYEIFEPHQAYGHEMEMSLIMSKLAHQASKEFNPELSPWILSRSGYAGIQKYAQTWTGDNYSSWNALQYDNAIIASMGISGLVHVGCDIGGFWGPDPEPELLLRWIQNGIFTPRFCIHSYKEKPTEPDMFADSDPKFFKIIQKFMALRSELLPYIEEASLKASKEGMPIMRPTVYDFQDDPNTYEQSFEYMFGDKYLIAPVYKPMAESKTREIYLPDKNTSWTHYFSGKKYQGGQTIKLELSFEEIPVFKKL